MAHIIQQYCEACGGAQYFDNVTCRGCYDRKHKAEEAAWDALPVRTQINQLRDRIQRLENPPKNEGHYA